MDSTGNRGRSWTLILVVVIVAMILCSVFSFFAYQNDLKTLMGRKTQQDLERATHQSVLLFDSMVSDYFKQLDLFASFCAANAGTDDEDIMRIMLENNKDNEYTKMGICTKEGILYTGDGQPVDISDNPEFKAAMNGESVISDVILTDDGKDLIVLAVPIMMDGGPAGAAMAEYDVQAFTELLGSSQFEGMGATLIMQRDGKMVSSYEGMENFDTFYDALMQMDFRGTDTLESFERRVQAGESGLFTYYRNGKERYLYFEPVGVNDWVMISLVMAESMDAELNAISERSVGLMAMNVVFYGVIIFCITLIVRKTRRIMRDNQQEALTGVYNKMAGRSLAEDVLRNSAPGDRHACLFMDVDGFKDVNDKLGHKEGDRFLVKFAGQLKVLFGENGIVSRFGGDEFLVFRKNVASHAQLEKEAQQLLERMRDKREFPATISVGIAFYPEDGTDYETLLNHADQALYESKRQGKNRYSVYGQEDARE